MAFKVTFVDGSSSEYDRNARFRFEASGVLVVTTEREQTFYSASSWLKVSAPAP